MTLSLKTSSLSSFHVSKRETLLLSLFFFLFFISAALILLLLNIWETHPLSLNHIDTPPPLSPSCFITSPLYYQMLITYPCVLSTVPFHVTLLRYKFQVQNSISECSDFLSKMVTAMRMFGQNAMKTASSLSGKQPHISGQTKSTLSIFDPFVLSFKFLFYYAVFLYSFCLLLSALRPSVKCHM